MTKAEASPRFLTSTLAAAIAFVALVFVVIVLVAGGDFALVAGTVVLDGFVLLAWIASCAGIGMAVLCAMKFECAAPLRWVMATAMGLGIESLLILSLGCAGILNRGSAIAMVVVGIGCAIWFLKSVRFDWIRQPAQFRWMWLALAPLVAITLACAALPPGILWGDEPNGYDVTEYHLQVPREWFDAGRIVGLQHNVFSYFPFNVEMHSLLAMHLMGGPWKGMYVAQLMHFSFMALTVIAIWALHEEKYPRGAIIAAVLAGATPWMGLLAPVAYNEGGLLLFGTLAIGLAMRSLAEARPTRWIVFAGAMAGFACGSKLTAAPMIVIPLPIIVVLARIAHRRERAHEVFLAAIGFWISAAVTFSPWLIRNAIWTHNPLFPEASSLFGKAHWTDTQVQRWQRANHLPRSDQQSVAGRFRAGWDQIVSDARFGYIVLPLAGLAILLRRDRFSISLAALLVFQLIFWLFFTHLQSRFFVLSIPICALLIGRIESRSMAWINTLLSLCVAVGGTLFVASKLAGIEQRLATYEIRLFNLAGLPTLRNFSRLSDADIDRTIELVGEGQAFQYDVPMSRLYYRTVFDVDAQPGEDAHLAWRRGWPTGSDVNVIVNEPELERFHQTYWQIPP